MYGQSDAFGVFSESFRDMTGRYHILENHVSIEQQMEYFRISETVRRSQTKLEKDEYDKFEEQLKSLNLSKFRKKKILSRLAVSSDVRAFRLLEDYVKHPDEGLDAWAQMALMESRIALETDLTGERHVYISTGLGGKEGKLRFYVLLLTAYDNKLEDYQCKIVENEFNYAASKCDCEIEKITFSDKYIEVIILNPVNENITLFLEKVVNECNIYGDFLSQMVTVTNVKALNKTEINQTLKENQLIQAFIS
ncbi:MAG: hypothetical protein LBR18_01070 [Tannerella sp.]|jgi:hypothetical protein|nr:hypothetical protein [Tannerella sp.]